MLTSHEFSSTHRLKCSAPVRQNLENATHWLLDAACYLLSQGDVSAGIDATESIVVMNNYHKVNGVCNMQ